MTLANLPGLWALLGIPAILAIHFLQRRSRRVTVTTRFLLDQLAPVSASGRRFERLRNSATLWLQLLAVLLVTWLLVQPRWLRPESRQTIVVILDSSHSMAAFRDRLETALNDQLAPLAASAAATDWIAIESDPAAPRIYSGPSFTELLAAIKEREPHLGTHDLTPALRLARNLARDQGTIVFVSDRPAELPDSVAALTIGNPIPNVGWIGLRTDEDTFTALVKNHGPSPVDVTWTIKETDTTTPLHLDPGQTQSITGTFAPESDRITLRLTTDEFTSTTSSRSSDRCPKELRLSWSPDSSLSEFFTRVADTLVQARVTPNEADLTLAEYDPLSPTAIAPRSITFLTDPSPVRANVSGTIFAEPHPLVADLNWQGLLVRDTFSVTPQETDEALLWQGDRPLIFLRGTGPERSLVLNFDLRQSNADRLPALIILLDRFAESIREQKSTYHRQNFELNESLNLKVPKSKDRKSTLLPAPPSSRSPPPTTPSSPAPPTSPTPARPIFRTQRPLLISIKSRPPSALVTLSAISSLPSGSSS